MRMSSIYSRGRISIPGSILFAALVVLSATEVGAIDAKERQVCKNTVEMQGSYNYARREIFRDLYGNGVTFAVRYERFLNEKLGVGVQISRVQLSNAEDYSIQKLSYRDLAISPMGTYSIVRNSSFRLFSGLGAGLSFREIHLESSDMEYEANQTETALHGLLMFGAELGLGGSMYLGARVTYDRHFFGDVTTGDFGDTGGFNFGGCSGIGF